ncbi:MAG: secretin N-terminal domain-containing protein [Planctomycetota bacterium]
MCSASLVLMLSLVGSDAAQVGGTRPETQSEVIRIESREGGLPLAELIVLAQQVLGYPIYYSKWEIAPDPAQAPALDFAGTIEVPRDEFLYFFELALRELDFLHVERSVGNLEFHAVHRVGPMGGKPTQLKSLARTVTPEELKDLNRRQILVTTRIQLEHANARDMATILTTYFADQFVESVRNLESANTLLLTGFASNVAKIVELIELMDQPPTTASASRIETLEKQVAELTKMVNELRAHHGPQSGKAAERGP